MNTKTGGKQTISQYCPICESYRVIKAQYRVEHLDTHKVYMQGVCKCGYMLKSEVSPESPAHIHEYTRAQYGKIYGV